MAKPKPPREKSNQDQILAYLVANGFLAWRNNSGMMFGDHKGKKWAVKFSTMEGLSDLQAVRDGRAVFIEVKRTAKDKPKPKQEVFLNAVLRYGGIAFVAVTIEDAYEGLRSFFEMIPPNRYNPAESIQVVESL